MYSTRTLEKSSFAAYISTAHARVAISKYNRSDSDTTSYFSCLSFNNVGFLTGGGSDEVCANAQCDVGARIVSVDSSAIAALSNVAIGACACFHDDASHRRYPFRLLHTSSNHADHRAECALRHSAPTRKVLSPSYQGRSGRTVGSTEPAQCAGWHPCYRLCGLHGARRRLWSTRGQHQLLHRSEKVGVGRAGTTPTERLLNCLHFTWITSCLAITNRTISRST